MCTRFIPADRPGARSFPATPAGVHVQSCPELSGAQHTPILLSTKRHSQEPWARSLPAAPWALSIQEAWKEL